MSIFWIGFACGAALMICVAVIVVFLFGRGVERVIGRHTGWM